MLSKVIEKNMGKKKRNSKEKDEDYIKKKIRKLEKKLKTLPQENNHQDSESDISFVSESQPTTPPLSSAVQITNGRPINCSRNN